MIAVQENSSHQGRPRVAFVESYPQVIAGQQRTMLTLLETWRSGFGEPVLVTPADGAFVAEAFQQGHTSKIVPYPSALSRYGGAIYRDGLLAKVRTKFSALQYVASARRALKQLHLDAVFCNDMRGLLTVGVAARSLRLPVIIWDKLDKPHGILDWLQLPLVSRNLVISQAVTTKYPAWAKSVYSKRIRTVSNGADLTRFNSATAIRESLGLGADDIVIGMIGTVTHRKAQDRLLKIIPQLCQTDPRIRILIVGSWEDSDEDRSYYAGLQDKDHPRVSFLGQRGDVPNILRSLDMLVIPSRHEGMGQVTAEAMACSLPVVGARAGGIPEIVEHGVTGFVFEGDNADEFADCILRLAASKELRETMGRAGRERVERHFNRPVQMRKVCEEIAALAGVRAE